ncbi:hypothetical protein [Aeromonas caviae]|uniref:hypothetical protein n=1 Tax=Aeromonas caviae TaxID=648 RepID=UPI0029D67159|nr:hypothetical protein [Aeromonas caviae]MDX7717472.1 hypothetical protein [Aeromonas caviae]
MVGEGFLRDLALFARFGRIGAVGEIIVPRQPPVIGTTFSVRFHVGSNRATAQIGDQQFIVKHGDERQHHVLDADPIQILLLVGSKVVARETITPTLLIPQLISTGLPATVTYANGYLVGRLIVENAETSTLTYTTGDENWQPLPIEADGRFVLPLQAKPHSVKLKVDLESKHAELSPLARRSYLHLMAVVHPQAVVNASDVKVTRFDESKLPIEFQWIRSALISYAGQSLPVEVINNRASIELQLDTSTVANQVIELFLEDLNGDVHTRSVAAEVKARPPILRGAHVPPNGHRHRIEMANISACFLRVPSRQIQIDVPIPLSSILIESYFLNTTEIHVAGLDDSGEEHCLIFKSSTFSHPWAKELPTMSRLRPFQNQLGVRP